MEINKDSQFPDKLDTGELSEEQLEKLEQEAVENTESKPKKPTKEETIYTPYLATGLKTFKAGDSLDPRIRTDSDGKVWLKVKDD